MIVLLKGWHWRLYLGMDQQGTYVGMDQQGTYVLMVAWVNRETKCFYLFVVHWVCSRFVTAKLVRLEKTSGLNSVGEHAQKFNREVQ